MGKVLGTVSVFVLGGTGASLLSPEHATLEAARGSSYRAVVVYAWRNSRWRGGGLRRAVCRSVGPSVFEVEYGKAGRV
jgi:hypothetical protein